MTDTNPQHVAITCTVEISSPVVDAGSDLSITIRTTAEPHCDLEGQTVEIRDEAGAVVAAGNLGAYDEATESNTTSSVVARAPLAVAAHRWSAHLSDYADAEVAFDAVTVPIAFATKAHTTTMLVWDVPRGIVAGERFKVRIGIKCSQGCRQAHRPFTVLDHEGAEVGSHQAGDAIWPKSEALYFTEIELEAPEETGHHAFAVQIAESELATDGGGAAAHTAASATFDVQSVPKPDFKVRIEAWDGAEKVPLKGARVLIHPYSGITDENGIAEIDVAAGDYRVFVSRSKYTTYGAPVTISGNLEARVDLYLEPPPNRE